MSTLLQIRDHETIAFTMLYVVLKEPTSAHKRAAKDAIDRYHGMIDTLGAQCSPELWSERNPLDRRVPA